MNGKYDAIVVGAGPGGATAAYGLAKAGLRVLLLEKEKLPRYKTCGGGLTAKVRGALDFDFSPAVEATIRHISIAYGAERTRIASASAWCVMRDKFDALLAERAASAGAELRDGSPVTQIDFDEEGATVSTRGERERAAFVVGADGANGIVRRAAGLPPHRRMAVALEAEMDAPSEALDAWRDTLHLDFSAISWGYAWIFPKAEHLSVGIGELVQSRSGNLKRLLARYVDSESTLRGARDRLMRGHRVPLGGEFGRYHALRALLVGDAAGVADPFSAEGIYYAIRSGQVAAEELARAFRQGQVDLAEYTRRINLEINADLSYAWALTQTFYRLPHLGYRIFAHSAGVQTSAGQVADGATTYRQMLWNVARSVLRLR